MWGRLEKGSLLGGKCGKGFHGLSFPAACSLQAGWTPLHWAIRNNHKEAAELLLDCAANIEAVTEVGRDFGRWARSAEACLPC